MTSTTTNLEDLTGRDAVDAARSLGLGLRKAADPIDDERRGIDPDDPIVAEVLEADPLLIRVDLEGLAPKGGER